MVFTWQENKEVNGNKRTNKNSNWQTATTNNFLSFIYSQKTYGLTRRKKQEQTELHVHIQDVIKHVMTNKKF